MDYNNPENEDHYIRCVGRTDNVFKVLDYHISPFELQSLPVSVEARTISLQAYHRLEDAMASAEVWLLLLADDTEVTPDADSVRTAREFMQEGMARQAPGKLEVLPETIGEPVQREVSREWFEREMGE